MNVSALSSPALATPLLTLPPTPAWRRLLRRVLGQHGLTIGAVILGLIVLAALFAP
ncbi:MAG: ABC transporter permease, partial [Variovorax sp.]